MFNSKINRNSEQYQEVISEYNLLIEFTPKNEKLDLDFDSQFAAIEAALKYKQQAVIERFTHYYGHGIFDLWRSKRKTSYNPDTFLHHQLVEIMNGNAIKSYVERIEVRQSSHYKTLLSFFNLHWGYLADEKKAAALTLNAVCNEGQSPSILKKHLPALNNGQLKEIYHQHFP